MILFIYILFVLYFGYKTFAGIYVYFKTDLKEIQKVLPTIKSKKVYLIGIFEHLIWVILSTVLYLL